MKYFKKFLIVGLFALFWVSFCNAELVKVDTTTLVWSQSDKTYVNNNCDMICINPDWTTCPQINLAFNLNHSAYAWSIRWWWDIWNTYWFCTNEHTVYYSSFDGCTFDIDCYQITEYSSLQCQTEYSLIPVSSVTENYCTANFDLISPSSCPISEWSGGTSRSALYLNNVQYAGASNIYVNFNDYLDWSTTYIDSWSSFVLDIDGYVADTWYMADILTIQEYHPSSEDFTSAFVGGLTLWLPYVIVALFVLFVRKLIKRIFKS